MTRQRLSLSLCLSAYLLTPLGTIQRISVYPWMSQLPGCESLGEIKQGVLLNVKEKNKNNIMKNEILPI